ncbi:MAG: methylenetetrahydrofolate reductase C-terminal domain-containing protein [Candidatus Bathyarchaeia archaeon]
MIIARRKLLEEILKMIKPYKKILILACDGCVGIYDVGGLKQAESLKLELELTSKIRGIEITDINVATVLRQCDTEIVKDSLLNLITPVDAILSLACGVGVQTLTHVFPNKPIFPANDTMFIAMENKKEEIWNEWCAACGNCILHETGGICPIARCAKSLLNGPCGGFSEGKCEVGNWVNDCAWVKIFERLKQLGKVNEFIKIRLPKDYREIQNPRKLSKDDFIAKEKNVIESIEIFREPGKRPAYSKLMKDLTSGVFVITGEVEPVKTTELTEVLEAAKILKDYVAAINVTDNPTAFAYMNALIPSYFIQEKVGVEAIYQMVTRDRNRLALMADLLAAGNLGIKNVLALTGDSTTVGDNPGAKKVWDLDSTLLIYMISRIVDEGVDLAGNSIINSPKFNIGAAANPSATPLEAEVYKLVRKQNAGADFLQTNSMYDIEVIKQFLNECKAAGIKLPILIGVTPFKSIKMMEWLVKYVPGIIVPDEIQEKLKKAREKSKEAFIEENIEIFSNLCKEIRNTTNAAGIHMMAVGFEWIVPKILERAKLK